MTLTNHKIDTFEALSGKTRVARINNTTELLEYGKIHLGPGRYQLSIHWDDGGVSEVMSWGKMPEVYCDAQDGELNEAMAWARAHRLTQDFYYGTDVMMSHPDILPLLQQIEALVDPAIRQNAARRLKACGAGGDLKRTFERCLEKMAQRKT